MTVDCPCTETHAPDQYCYDQATPDQRQAFEFLYGHAYNYASVGGTFETDDAEAYAAWYAGRHFAYDLDEAPQHPYEHEQWRNARDAEEA